MIVAIKESTTETFAYSSPIDRGFLNDLVTWLAAQSPRAIGIDVLFDQPTEPAKDDALRHTLATLPVPLVVSYVDNPDNETPERIDYLNTFVPQASRGLANLAEDPFDTARYIMLGNTGPDGVFVPSFPRLMAMKLGVTPPNELIEIAWHGTPTPDDDPFPMYTAELVKHLKPAFFRNKVVLIGSDYALTDRHRTPFAAVYEGAKGQLPGIVIEAHALAQLIDHRPPDRPSFGVNYAITLFFALCGAIIGQLERSFLYTAIADLFVLAAFWIGAFTLFHQERILVELLP